MNLGGYGHGHGGYGHGYGGYGHGYGHGGYGGWVNTYFWQF